MLSGCRWFYFVQPLEEIKWSNICFFSASRREEKSKQKQNPTGSDRHNRRCLQLSLIHCNEYGTKQIYQILLTIMQTATLAEVTHSKHAQRDHQSVCGASLLGRGSHCVWMANHRAWRGNTFGVSEFILSDLCIRNLHYYDVTSVLFSAVVWTICSVKHEKK